MIPISSKEIEETEVMIRVGQKSLTQTSYTKYQNQSAFGLSKKLFYIVLVLGKREAPGWCKGGMGFIPDSCLGYKRFFHGDRRSLSIS